MTHKIIMIGLCLFVLNMVGCSREQQNEASVDDRETSQVFTTLPESVLPPKMTVPEIPGKAEIAGAPIPNSNTKKGSAFVRPESLLPDNSKPPAQ